MRTVRYLLLALAAGAALTACSGEAARVAVTPAAAPEDVYIAQLEESVPTYIVQPKRDELIRAGYDVCQTINNGQLSEPEIVSAVARVHGLQTSHAEALTWAARDNLCPDLDF